MRKEQATLILCVWKTLIGTMNGYIDVDAEPVHNGRGLEITWEQVDETVGASQMYHGRNFPRAACGLILTELILRGRLQQLLPN